MYSTIEEFILNKGYNLENEIIDSVDITKTDLRGIKLPKDPELFQKVKDKSLFGTKLPDGDYSEYNFKGVDLARTVFTTNSVLPKNRDLFLSLKRGGLFETNLPEINFDDYDFEGVILNKVIFSPNSKMSTDMDFFQKIHQKSIYGVTLPVHDYSQYNFNEVLIVGCDFKEKSTLPQDPNFFQLIANKLAYDVTLPMSMIDNIHLYNLSDVGINLSDFKINIIRSTIIYEKYYFEENISFPENKIESRKSTYITVSK